MRSLFFVCNVPSNFLFIFDITILIGYHRLLKVSGVFVLFGYFPVIFFGETPMKHEYSDEFLVNQMCDKEHIIKLLFVASKYCLTRIRCYFSIRHHHHKINNKTPSKNNEALIFEYSGKLCEIWIT